MKRTNKVNDKRHNCSIINIRIPNHEKKLEYQVDKKLTRIVDA